MGNTHLLSRALFVIAVCSTGAMAQMRLLSVDGSNLLEIDPASGATLQAIPITGPTGLTGELTYDPATDTLFLASYFNGNLWKLDRHTGVGTLVGPFSVGALVYMTGIEVDDTGHLYGFGYDTGINSYCLYSVDRNTGLATVIAATPFLALGALAFVPATQTMYVTDTGNDELWTIDRSTGAVALVGPLIPVPSSFVQIGAGLAYDPAHGMYAMDNYYLGRLFTIDLATGAATLVGPMGTTSDRSLVWVPADVPPVPICPGDGSATPCPCSNSGATGHGCANSADPAGALLSAAGYALLANDTLVLTSSHETASAPSLFVQGSALIAPISFGDGLRCAGGVLKRMYLHNASGGVVSAPSGSDASISARSAALGDPLAPGAQRVMQVYYRDPSVSFCPDPPGGAYNISNALLVTWN